MPLRDAPTPRMAGHLPFMRGPSVSIGQVKPGQLAAFGVALGDGREDTSLGPLALRETSGYFGSHFTANMKAAMDIDRRMRLDGAAIAGRIVDLGDIDFLAGEATAGERVAALSAEIARRGALPAMLGGSARFVAPMRDGLEDALRRPVDVLRAPARPLDGRACLASIDLGAIASTWHGGSRLAGLHGLALSQCREWLRGLGREDVVGVALTGLDPSRQGLSTVKTGQRLLVTAVLDLVYARLDALRPVEKHHG